MSSLKIIGWVLLVYVLCAVLAFVISYIVCRLSRATRRRGMVDEDWETVALVTLLGPIGLLVMLAAFLGA